MLNLTFAGLTTEREGSRMSGKWQFFVDDKPWDKSKRLFAIRTQSGFDGQREHIHSLVAQPIERGIAVDVPLLEESWEDDGVGDVTGFLQAAMDAGWEMGLRPAGARDHTNELKAVRYHLEDMRALALPKNEAAKK